MYKLILNNLAWEILNKSEKINLRKLKNRSSNNINSRYL